MACEVSLISCLTRQDRAEYARKSVSHSDDVIFTEETRYPSSVHIRSGEAKCCTVTIARLRSSGCIPKRGDIKAMTPCIFPGAVGCNLRQSVRPRTPTVAILGAHIATSLRIGLAGSSSSPGGSPSSLGAACSFFAPSKMEDMVQC